MSMSNLHLHGPPQSGRSSYAAGIADSDLRHGWAVWLYTTKRSDEYPHGVDWNTRNIHNLAGTLNAGAQLTDLRAPGEPENRPVRIIIDCPPADLWRGYTNTLGKLHTITRHGPDREVRLLLITTSGNDTTTGPPPGHDTTLAPYTELITFPDYATTHQ